MLILSHSSVGRTPVKYPTVKMLIKRGATVTFLCVLGTLLLFTVISNSSLSGSKLERIGVIADIWSCEPRKATIYCASSSSQVEDVEHVWLPYWILHYCFFSLNFSDCIVEILAHEYLERYFACVLVCVSIHVCACVWRTVGNPSCSAGAVLLGLLDRFSLISQNLTK